MTHINHSTWKSHLVLGNFCQCSDNTFKLSGNQTQEKMLLKLSRAELNTLSHIKATFIQ